MCMLMSGCAAADTNEPITGAQTFYLSSNDIDTLKSEVADGSGNAAFKLYEYYAFFCDDHTEAVKWLRIADERGVPLAKKHMSTYQK